MRKFRLLSLVLIAAMIIPFSPVTAQTPAAPTAPRTPAQTRVELLPEPPALLELAEDIALPAHLDPALTAAQGPVQVVLELQDEPTVVVYAKAVEQNAPQAQATRSAKTQLAQIETAQQRLLSPLAELDAAVLYRTQRVYNGIAIMVDAKHLPELVALPGVKAIYPLIPKESSNWFSVPMIGSAALWDAAGAFGGLTGVGIKVAVIDTGIDYIHAGFGGPAVPAAYAANITTVITDTYLGNPLFPTAKVVGGIDLVGDSYNATITSPSYQPIPYPDPDPMDCQGHGTHVAGSAAGYGVNADGSTYMGPYDVAAAAAFNALAVGPGVAPGADLYAVRVFGCAGSTNVTDLALEWSVDPNGDGDFSDRMDVVNMSLGSAYGSMYDSSAIAADNVAMLGVIVVASAGNNGDVYYITGSPAVSGRTISVAASDDGAAVLGAFEVLTAITMTLGLYPAVEAGFGPDIAASPVQNDLVLAAPATGCTALTNAAAVSGKIALIDRGTCSFQTKVYQAQQAGAIAVLVANNVAGDPFTMGADATVPAVSIPSQMTDLTTGNALKAELPAGPVTIRLSADYRDSIRSITPALKDTIGSFSSRGPRRVDSFLKPDITAPGVSIFSLMSGTGTRGVSMQGTSMAAPHVAGAMALLREQHPSWSVEELKALAMNTALNDIATTTAVKYGSGRVGAGRITLDKAASSPVVAYNAGAPGLVSVSFGALEIAQLTTLNRQIRVVNKGSSTVTYTVSYAGYVDMPGVAYSVSPAQVVLPPYGVKTVQVTLTADPALMRRTGRDATVSSAGPRHWLSEEAGYAVLTPSTPALSNLRVPLYVTARPVSAMATQQTALNFTGVTGSAVITLTGTGLNTGAIYGTTDYLSLVTAFELQEVSPDDPDENPAVNNADLKYVGVANNYAGTGIASTLYFAIATHGKHSSAAPGDAEFDIYVDINEDGVPDYVIWNTTTGGSAPNDVIVTVVLNLNTGVATLSNYVNIYTAGQYDTKIFNSDVMVLPVATSLLGLSTQNPRFNYWVDSFSRDAAADDPVDASAVHSFTVGKPGLQFGTSAPIFSDLPGNAIPVSFYLPAYKANASQGVLLLHHHNANGATAQVLPVTTTDTVVNFSVLHTNDFHGHLESASGSTSNPGFARTATVINDVRAAVDPAYVLLLDAGDTMQGSLISNIQQGRPTIDLYNFVGYNVSTLGNHEFDWGQTVLQERIDQANFPYLAANLTVKVGDSCAGWTPPDFVEPWTILDVGAPGNQAKVGVIGITSIETPYITVVEATQGLCFKDPAEAVIRYYDAVKAAGADAIVVLTHIGNVDGGYGYGFPVYGDQTLARRLVQAGKPAHLIIGGHSHTDLAAAQNISNTLVVQAQHSGRKVGRANFSVNKSTGAVTVTWQRLTVNPANAATPTAEDPAVKARIAVWTSDPAYQALINQIIGFSNVDLIRDYNGDSLMGKFIQDAIYNDLNTDAEPLNDVDMVFNNPGGIRVDLTSPTYPFTLTYGMLYSVLPFGNATVVGDMTGAALLELLNQSASLFRGAIQVAGIRYKFYSYTDAHPGPQPWAWGAYDVTVYDQTSSTWEPLEIDRTYRVATNEFLAPAGQDGFSAFKYMTNISYWGDMLDGVNRWVAATHGTRPTAYNEALDGRITRDGNNSGGSVIPVTILHNNDSHGYFTNYYRFASAVKEQRLHNPDRTLLLNAGDQIQGDSMMYYFKTAALGYAADGQTLPITMTTHPMMAIMNELDYDAMTVANHEYNFGNAVFTSTLAQANFPMLQANVYDDGRYGLAQVPVEADASFALPVSGGDDIKVAVLGIGNHRVPNYELPSNIPGLSFTSPITETQGRAPALKADNDVVIALTHIGFTENPASIEVDENVDTNLAQQTTAVDAIIGGHSHTDPAIGFGATKYLPTIFPNANGEPVIINQAGRRNLYLGVTVLGLLPKSGGGYEVVARSGRFITTSSYAQDSAAKAVGDPYTAWLDVYNNTIIGRTTAPIDTLAAYTQETNGANLQADASVWELADHGIDVDFHLSGAMSNARVAATATVTAPVDLTVANMFSLMPFENSLVVMEINGPQLKAILERGYRNYYYYKYVPAAGGYSYYTTCMLDVDAGNQVTYRDTYPLLPNGNNVVSLEVNGQFIDFEDAVTTYKVSTVNYLAAGSCNFNNSGVSLWPLDNIIHDTQFYVRDAVINYITAMALISPAIEGRLVFNPFAQTTGLTVAPAADAKGGPVGTIVEYTLQINNTGNMADTFLLSYTGVWNVAMPASVVVGAGATADVTVRVTVPAGATIGDMDVTTVTAKSQAAPTTQAQAVLTTTAIAPPTYTLDVNIVGNGTVAKDPDQATYFYGDVVTLTATPATNWLFAGWSGGATGTTNPLVITIMGDTVITATFSLDCIPVAGVDFTWSPLKPLVGEVVNFNATVGAGTSPLTYTWNFGHGADEPGGATIAHTFPLSVTEVTYTVELTVVNPCTLAGVAVEKAVTVYPRRVFLPLVLK